jgi:hypothetical protein
VTHADRIAALEADVAELRKQLHMAVALLTLGASPEYLAAARASQPRPSHLRVVREVTR